MAIPSNHIPGSSCADVIDERVTMILTEEGDLLDTGIQQIAERKINNPTDTAERDCGFGTVVCQDV
jgi:hypothetical protein